jgi:hypothetical protein
VDGTALITRLEARCANGPRAGERERGRILQVEAYIVHINDDVHSSYVMIFLHSLQCLHSQHISVYLRSLNHRLADLHRLAK